RSVTGGQTAVLNWKYCGSRASQSKIIASPIETTSIPPMKLTARPWRTSGRRIDGARQERQPEPDRVGDQEDRPLGDRRARRGHRQDPAEDHADARRPADGEDRAQAERREPPAATADESPTQPIAERRRAGCRER